MRQTLIRIPIDGPWSLGPLGEWPGFGFGIVLGLWIALGAYWVVRNRRDLRWNSETLSSAGAWCAIAAVIVLLPRGPSYFGGLDTKIKAATAALEHNPRAIDALLARSEAYFAKRDYAKAVEDLKAAVSAAPENLAARDRLAWILATCENAKVRDGDESAAQAMKACEQSGFQQAGFIDTLAAAQARQGRFDEAVATAERAAAVAWQARDKEDRNLIPAIRERLRSYQAQRPWRETAAGWHMPVMAGWHLPVFGYGFMLFAGFVLAGWAATRRAALVGIGDDVIWDLAMWMFVFGIPGARIYYCVQHAENVFYDRAGNLKDVIGLITSAVNLPDGGLVLYGGVIAGAVAHVAFCLKRKLSFALMADVVIPSLFIGVAFGRIGCLLNGCCWGDRCTLPWAVTFPLGSVPDSILVDRGIIDAAQPFSLALHPTQLYSSLDAAILALLTHAYFRYRPRNGSVLALGLLTYPITRFAIEMLRGDEMGQFHTPLTTAQFVSIAVFATGLVYAAWLSRRPAAA